MVESGLDAPCCLGDIALDVPTDICFRLQGRIVNVPAMNRKRASDRIWALVCGFPEPTRSNRPLLMLQAFIDDSRSAEPPAFVLAGFIAPADKWAAFSDEWQQFLDMPPVIKYFKMSEAMSFSGEFAHWTEDRRNERLRLMHRVIEDHVSAGIMCIIRPDEYANVFKNSVVPKKIHNPYYFLFFGLITALVANQHRIGLQGKIDFIFDEQMMEKSTIDDLWTSFKLLAEVPKDLLGDPPIFRNDQTMLPLQAADMCAWVARMRFLQTMPPLPWIRKKEVLGLEFIWTEQMMRERLDYILDLQAKGKWPPEDDVH